MAGSIWATMCKNNISSNLVLTIEQLNDKAANAVLMNGSMGEKVQNNSRMFTVGIKVFHFMISVDQVFYTPDIYAYGYIAFSFPFARLYVRDRTFVYLFFRSLLSVTLRQMFWLKFLLVTLSLQPLGRMHSYLNHGYLRGSASMSLLGGAYVQYQDIKPGRVAKSVGHLTRKSGVLCSIPGLATYFRFSFRFFKNGSCQSLAKVCARSTG